MRIFLLAFVVASIFSFACSDDVSLGDGPGRDQAVDVMGGDVLPVGLEAGPVRDGSAEVMGTLDNAALNEASGLVPQVR